MELERIERKSNILKAWWFPWAVGALAVVIAIFAAYITSYNAGYASGKQSVKAKIDGKMITYHSLLKKVHTTKNNLLSSESKLSKTNAKLQSSQSEFSKLKDLQDHKDAMQQAVADSKSKLSDLNSQISSAQAKLNNLQGGVQKAAGKPIILGAGRFYVGKDIPAGRYKAVPVGGDENFETYDQNGDGDVITILGNSSGETPSYVFSVLSGYTIETGAATKFIPVK